MCVPQIIAVAWLMLLCALAPAHAEKRVALVVGNAAYRHADRLANPVNDARGMRDALTALKFDVVYGEDLDLKALRQKIGQFAGRVDGADVALVYFAGHGATFGDTPYVVPVDAEFSSLDAVPYELVAMEMLIGELRRAKGVRIVILDACRDNGTEAELKRHRGGAVTRGLAPMKNPSGLIIAYATQYMSTAADDAGGGRLFSGGSSSPRHSPFTAALLNNIATPDLDVKEMFFKVGSEVDAATGGKQQPEISISMYGRYMLAPGADDPGAATVPAFPSAATAPASPSSEDALDFTALYKGEITFWISARPENFKPSLLSQFKSDFPEQDLRSFSLLPDNFLAALERRDGPPPPDVAFIDNYTQLKPLLDRRGVWLTWGADRFDKQGWWVIFRNSSQIAKSQAFIRWLSRSPKWVPMRVENTSISVEQIDAVQQLSIATLNNYLEGKSAELLKSVDSEAADLAEVAGFGILGVKPDDFRAADVKPILTFGNNQLAFAVLAAVGSSDNVYGMRHFGFILRREHSAWRVLHIAPLGLPELEKLFGAFDAKIKAAGHSLRPPKPVLVSPPDGAQLPRFPSKPEIRWQASGSPREFENGKVSFLVESQFTANGQTPPWSPSYLQFVEPSRGKIPLGVVAPFGVGKQPHRWRIWALDQAGTISISDWRTIEFIN